MKGFRSFITRRSKYVLAGIIILVLSGAWSLLQGQGYSTAAAEKSCDSKSMSDAQIAAYRGISLDTMHSLIKRQSLAPADICEIPQDELDEAVDEALNPEPDEPGEALDFRDLSLQDENGNIPGDGLVQGKSQIEAMAAVEQLNAAGAGISSSSWTWIGPGNVGGRVRAIVVHPTDPNTLWAASVSGGIWKSTDAGASWHILSDFMTSMTVSSLAIDPRNPAVLYAGTGEGFYGGDGIRGAGIFKTTNGGSTWSQLSATNTPDWYYVDRLAIAPSGSTILAATKSGIWRSLDEGLTWSHSTSAETLDVNFSPSDNNKAVAGGCGGRAGYSLDGGQTWTAAALSGVGRVELAYAGPASSNTVYASVDVNGGEIWKSTNGGTTYARVNTGSSFLGGQGWYANAIWVDPTNANNLVVGGVDLWRSTDGGATISAISEWWSAPINSPHADQHIIVQSSGFNGGTNKTLYFGNDGGIYRAGNYATVARTSGWTNLNNSLGITQFYSVAANPSGGGIIGGTQDNGTLFYAPGAGTEGWTTTFGGDGGFAAADPTNANYYYGEYAYLNLHRSSDGGASADYISGQYRNGSAWAWKPAPYRIDDAMNKRANFVAPFILDPNNANRLLAGGASLWRTNDARTANSATSGPSWAVIKPQVGTGSEISAIAVAPGNSNIVWVGYNDGQVWMTTNGTVTSPAWSRVGVGSPNLPSRFVTSITIDANRNSVAYVTFGGFSSNNVWRTADSGLSWADITGSGLTGLPDLPVRTLAINPANSQWLYVGTELGVFTSEDSGKHWAVPQDGPTNTSVEQLAWMNSTLVAATHGRGLFKATTLAISSGGPALTAAPASSNYGMVKVGATSAASSFTIRNTGSSNLVIGTLSVTGTNPGQFLLDADTCSGATLTPNGACTVAGAFRPTSVGIKKANINIPDNATGSPHHIALSGKGATEQAKNGGFNIYPSVSATLPMNWKAIDFVSTDGADSVNMKEGSASIVIGNTSLSTKTLKQARTVSGKAGDAFLFSLWAKGNGIPTTVGVVKAQVQLYNGTALVQNKAITFPNGTYAFMQKKLSFTAAGAYTRIVIKLTYSKESGTVWFDALSLLKSP